MPRPARHGRQSRVRSRRGASEPRCGARRRRFPSDARTSRFRSVASTPWSRLDVSHPCRVVYTTCCRHQGSRQKISWPCRGARREAVIASCSRWRKTLGRPTFKEIGEAIGITERQVQRWFAGDGDVGRESLKKLADFLGTTPDYIEYGVTRRERTDNPDHFLIVH